MQEYCCGMVRRQYMLYSSLKVLLLMVVSNRNCLLPVSSTISHLPSLLTLIYIASWPRSMPYTCCSRYFRYEVTHLTTVIMINWPTTIFQIDLQSDLFISYITIFTEPYVRLPPSGGHSSIHTLTSLSAVPQHNHGAHISVHSGSAKGQPNRGPAAGKLVCRTEFHRLHEFSDCGVAGLVAPSAGHHLIQRGRPVWFH